MLNGLEDENIRNEMAAAGNQLWAVEPINKRLYNLSDTLTAAVIPLSPDNLASGVNTTSLDLK
jgi:hypothetical protein